MGWDKFVGKDGAAEIEARQLRINEHKRLQRERGRDLERLHGNPRSDLVKTELCHFYRADEECEWITKPGGCWFAHGRGELRVASPLSSASSSSPSSPA